MRSVLILLFLYTLHLTTHAQSGTLSRLELKRLALENKYRTVWPFDTLTGIAKVYDDGKTGYIDTNGILLLPLRNIVTSPFSDGLGLYNDIDKNVFRIIDKSGKVKKKFRNFLVLRDLKDRRMIFMAQADGLNKCGIMDLDGKIIIPNKYPHIERISSKYYFVNSNKDGAGILNYSGDTVIPLKYVFIYIDTNDLHFVGARPDVGYAIFDSGGTVRKFLAKEIYFQSFSIGGKAYYCHDSVMIIKDRFSPTEAKTALVNLNFDTIVPMGAYRMRMINEQRVGFSVLTSPNETKFGFFDTRGKQVIPPVYDQAIYFTEGLCAVKQNSKWGYIDREGRIAIPLQYDYAHPFQHGYAKVQVRNKFFIIDRTGKIVLNSRPN